MRVALVQMNAGPHLADNLQKATELLGQAARQRARWALLPEVFCYRGPLARPQQRAEVFESIPGPSTIPLQELAARQRMYILAGSIYERTRVSGRAYNTSVLVGPDGQIVARYRKRHLFAAQIETMAVDETQRFLPGRRRVTARVDDFLVGMSVCFDVRFPELYQGYARQGCGVLTVPASFTRHTGEAHWEALLRARAIENLCYVLAPNQTGQDGHGVPSFGHSLVISPWGEVLARASGEKEEVVVAEISTREIDQARSRFPGLISRRFRFDIQEQEG